MSKKILVVDDNESEVKAFLDHLMRHEWRVEYASGGDEALLRIEEEAPDLIISDWDMPGMTGHQLMERLEDKLADDQIIFLLAHYDWPIGMWSRPTRMGRTADSHVMKPYHVEEMAYYIHRMFTASDESRKDRQNMMEEA